MATDVSNPYTEHVETNNVPNNNSVGNDEILKKDNINKTPTQKNSKNDIDQSKINISNANNERQIRDTHFMNDQISTNKMENKHDLPNERESKTISIRKLEDLCVTPDKSSKLNKSIDTVNIKLENTSSPQVDRSDVLNASTMDWFSESIKSLVVTPSSYSEKKSRRSESPSPTKHKRRKISNGMNDYDQLSNMLKLEIEAPENDIEAIDMLHDLSSVMDFEDTKIPADFFCSIYSSTQNADNTEIHPDPQTDPLSLCNSNENFVKFENIESKQIKEENNVTPRSNKHEEQQYHSRRQTQCNRTNIREGCSDSGNLSDEAYNTIKNVLGVLDIPSEADSETMFKTAREKLYDLDIELLHEVPPQHKIENTAGSKPLTNSEKHLFLSLTPLKKGAYSEEEDEIIKQNWETFCHIHDWDPTNVQPFVAMKHKNRFYIRTSDRRRKFVQFIANGLPQRTLYSVYNRFKTLYRENRQHSYRYTLQEDEQILQYIKKKCRSAKKKRTRFSDLSKILGRPKNSIWLRYQLLQKKGDTKPIKLQSKVEWTLPLIGNFIRTLIDVTLSEDVEELKDTLIPKPVWLKLQEKLMIRYHLLKVFWIHQLHMQLFCPEPIYLNDIKIKLIEYFYGKGISNSRGIIWPKVAKYFEGVTTIFLCKLFFDLVRSAAQKAGTNDFPAIIEYLYDEKISEIQNEETDKYLPRLSYKDGNVTIIDDIDIDADTE